MRMEQRDLNIYDQNFKAVMQIAPLSAYILKCLHPEFYKWPLETVIESIHRDSSRTITLRNTEFSFNGHIMHADSLGSAYLPVEGSDTFSRYLIHFEMQLEDTPGYDLERRQLTYAHGLLDTFKTDRLYDETPQIISIWLHPLMSTMIDEKPKLVIGSGNMDTMTSFFGNEEGWYNEINRKRLKSSANKPIATILDLWMRICELDEVIGLRNHAVVMHFRYATSGSKDPGNCHPYPISDKTERLRKTVTKCRHAAFCHNGVIPEYSLPNSTLNDTQHFSKRVLSKLSRVDKHFFHREETREFLHTLCRSKLCFLDSSGQIYTVGEFKQLGSCKFSNLNFMNGI